jgi:hypothetical protein
MVLFASLLAIGGCSGGGSPPAPIDNAPHILTWQPPTTWTDNTVLDPLRDLDRNDIALSDDGLFADNDVVASVSAADNGAVVNLFDLLMIRPGASAYPQWVSVKTWAWDNACSEWAKPVLWEK